ncbi:hypothetical protein HYW66_01950, partial [Candidatus Microgenomates bacterium]|nr:hypothetical protein [Candidatus Microgenomates bacterium]
MADQAPDLSKQQTGNAADSPWTSTPSTPPPVATSSPPPPPQPASQPANWWDQLQPTPAEEPKISTQPLPPEEEPIVKPVVEPSPPTVPEPSSPAPAFSVPPPPASSPPPTVPAETGRGLPNVLGLLIKLLVGLAVIIVLIILITKTLSFVQQKRTPGITTLTYWGLWEDKNVIDTVVADFTRDHPDIKIDYQKRDIKQYRETLKSRLVSGQGPDI